MACNKRLILFKLVRCLLIAIISFGIIWLVSMFFLQRWIIFPSYMVHPTKHAGRAIADLQELSIPSPDGPVLGWFIPGKGVSAENPGPAAIFAHGNAELIEHWPALLDTYRELGISLLLPEFRGYGHAPGTPSEKAITQDFLKFHDLLVRRPDVDPKRIIHHGRSIGGGVICTLARQRPPAVLILQSTFTSIKDMASDYYAPRFLVRDHFDNLAVVSKLDCPLLIFHGRHDRTIPFAHAEKLHKAAKQSTFIPYEADHNDCPPDWEHYWQQIRKFLLKAKIIS